MGFVNSLLCVIKKTIKLNQHQKYYKSFTHRIQWAVADESLLR